MFNKYQLQIFTDIFSDLQHYFYMDLSKISTGKRYCLKNKEFPVYSWLMKRTAAAVIIIMVIIIFQGCGNNMDITVKDYRMPVLTWEGPLEAYIMVMPDGGETNWIWGIEGFGGYEWGKVYKLKVKKKKIKNPPEDAPSHKYKLVRIISEGKPDPDKLFTLPLKQERTSFIRTAADGSLTLLDDAVIILDSGISERELSAAFLVSDEVYGNFLHGSANKIVLKSYRHNFDSKTASLSMRKLFPDIKPPSIANWKERDFISFFTSHLLDGYSDQIFKSRP